MARAKYLAVCNWDRYQHYKERQDGWRPSWIKLYVSVLDDVKFAQLPIQARWMFIAMLLLAAKNANLIHFDTTWLANRAHISPTQAKNAVDVLLKNGFIKRVSASSSRKTLENSLEQIREEKIREEKAVHTDSHSAAETALANITKNLRGVA